MKNHGRDRDRKMTDYREGDQEMVEEKEEQKTEEEKKEPGVEKGQAVDIPVTAFLVMAFPNGKIDVVTDFNNINVARKATTRDIRDLCNAVSKDVEMVMTAEMVQATFARHIQASFQQNMMMNQNLNNLRNPKH